ncbi:MAG: NRDE family protein [Myxococcota bacterium]
MCTLIVLHRCVPGRPLVVAANRDEFLDRPAEDMALRSSATGQYVSPLDLEAGGTWVGLSARGVFVGLTNLRPPESQSSLPNELKEKLRSRGDVVMMALEAESAAEAVNALRELEAGVFNPFQLLVADGTEAWLVVYRDEVQAVQLEPGPHIVGNVVDDRIEERLGTSSNERVATSDSVSRMKKMTRIRECVEKMMTETGQDLFEGLASICREHVGSMDSGWEAHETEGEPESDGHEPSPFESTCVHVAEHYGTRSSLLLELSADLDACRLWTTEGPPCERPYENRSSLLRALGVTQSFRTETEMA